MNQTQSRLRPTLIVLLALLALAALGAARAAADPVIWGGPGNGPGQFDRPWDVALSPEGRPYFADRGNDRVQLFTGAGEFLGQFGGFGSATGKFEDLVGVAVAPDGKVFALDRRPAGGSGFRIQRFSAAGAYELGWGTETGSALGQFDDPTDIAVGPNGRVYVSEAGNHRIQSFSADGTDPVAWGTTGSGGAGQFVNPLALAIDPTDGWVYVADGGNTPEVQVFNPAGTFSTGWGQTGNMAGQFPPNGLAGIAAAPNGTVITRDYDPISGENHRFQRFQANGVFLSQQYWTTFTEPRGLAITPTEGTLYAPDPGGNRVQVFDLSLPTVSLLAPYLPVGVGETAVFQATASVPLGQIVKHEWDLDGDGVYELDTGTVPEARRTYSSTGPVTVRLRVTSNRGGTAVDTRQIEIDVPPPPGPVGVTINDGARFTRDRNVTLTVRWPRWAKSMAVSNDGAFVPATHFGVAATIPWRLDTSGPQRQPQIVYVRFDEGEATFQDNIIFDRQRPAIRVTYVPVDDGTSRVRLAVRDKTSGVGAMQLKPRGRKPGAWRKFSKTLSVRGSAAGLRVRVRDRAGNFSRWAPATPRRG